MCNKTTIYEVCLEDLDFLEAPIEVRVVVFSTILRELGLRYKKYYTKKNLRSFKRVKRPVVPNEDELTISYNITASAEHIKYAEWLYERRMKDVVTLYRMYNTEVDK